MASGDAGSRSRWLPVLCDLRYRSSMVQTSHHTAPICDTEPQSIKRRFKHRTKLRELIKRIMGLRIPNPGLKDPYAGLHQTSTNLPQTNPPSCLRQCARMLQTIHRKNAGNISNVSQTHSPGTTFYQLCSKKSANWLEKSIKCLTNTTPKRKR